MSIGNDRNRNEDAVAIAEETSERVRPPAKRKRIPAEDRLPRVLLNGELRTSARKRLPAEILGRRYALVLEFGLLASALVLQGVLFARGLDTPADYDEGVYL